MVTDLADSGDDKGEKPEKMFTLKKWNAVAMWSWDVECDTCAICRVQVMGKFFFGVSLFESAGQHLQCFYLTKMRVLSFERYLWRTVIRVNCFGIPMGLSKRKLMITLGEKPLQQ